MKNIFISNIKIENVRHLKNITIPLTREKCKHLIFTGKNGSGKTSVLQAIANYLNGAIASNSLLEAQELLTFYQNKVKELESLGLENNERLKVEKAIEECIAKVEEIKSGLCIEFNEPTDTLYYHFEKGNFVLAYYKAERTFQADIPKHIEKINLQEIYKIDDTPRQLFVKYLVDIKMTEALAQIDGEDEKANEIKNWFTKFRDLLRKIFDDETLELVFERDTFSFFIKEKNRELFDFNSLSSGFAAVLDIVLDLIMRMEKATKRSFDFNIPGIVLIDEIETHLHLELQKTILELLTTVFPNVQFIVSTHSPFILNSLEDVVIYDLENNTLVEHGLVDVPYNGIVEGYFHANEMSNVLKKKYEKYKSLVKKEYLTDDDFEEIAKLELFLNEIPDYLALNITTEYQRLKMEFESREDI